MTGRPLAVVIVSGPRAEPLRRCLDSVRAHLPGTPVYAWVNTGAGRPQFERLAAEHPQVHWTLRADDMGYAAAVNAIVPGTTGDLLLLRPDVELLGPLTAARHALTGHRVAVVAPLDEPTEQDEAWDVARRAPTATRAVVARAGWDRRLRGSRWSDRYATNPATSDVGHLVPGCLLVSRGAWDDVGPFNERSYFVSGEDREWQQEARARGWLLRLAGEPQLRRGGDGSLSGPQPAQRLRDLELITTAIALGIRNNAGPGSALLAADLLLGRLRRSRPFRRSRQAVPALHAVIITTPRISIGGAERQRVMLANELARRGHPVTLVCLHDLGHLQRELHPDVRLVLRPWWQPFVNVSGDEAVLISGTTNIEIGFAAIWAAVTGAGIRRRWLVAVHRGPDPEVRRAFSWWLARAIGRSDGVIALSERHWDDLTDAQHLHRRHWSVPNGVDLGEDREYRPGSPLRIGFLGRIIEAKNPHLLVAALAELAEFDWRLDIFGSGPDEERLQSLVPDEIRDRVHWRGRTAGPAPALAEMDLLCLPSRHEAFPLVLLEAMACGIPTMATAVCAVPEILDDGRAGVLIPEATLHEWITALRPVLTEPESLGKIARTGRERVKSLYTIDAMTDGYQKVMATALADPRRPT